MSSTFHIGVIKATRGSVQKRILNVNGKPEKDKNHYLGISQGEARTVEFRNKPLVGLANLISNLKPNEAITLGVPLNAGTNRIFTKDQLEKLKNFPSLNVENAISRSKEHYQWPIGTHAVLLDHDPEPGQPELTADEFWAAVLDVAPELEGCGRVVTVSTSSSIYEKATGKCLKPASGHHTYLIVRGDVEKFTHFFYHRTWLKGRGFHKLGNPNDKTGVPSILERGLIDESVHSPERLVYEAGAIVPPDFEQRRTEPKVYAGEILDIDALPKPTPEEVATVRRLVEESRKKLETQRGDAVVAHVKKEQPGISIKEAKAVAKERIKAVDGGLLERKHVLYLADGSTLKAGDIGLEHNGKTLCDPQEPTYRGGRSDVAKIYCTEKGNWTITSFAHASNRAPCAYRPAWVVKAERKKLKEATESESNWAKAAGVEPRILAADMASSTDIPAIRREIEVYKTLEKEHRRAVLEMTRTKAKYTDRVVNTGGSFDEADFDRIARHDGPTVISGATGSGKTEFAAQMSVWFNKQYPNSRIVGTSPTRVLSGEKAARFSAKGLPMVSTADDPSAAVKDGNVDTPAESIYKTKGKRIDFFAADEPDTWAPRLLGQKLGDAVGRNLEALKRLMKDVAVDLWLNANVNPITVDFLEEMSGFPVSVVELVRTQETKPAKVKLFLDHEDKDGNTVRGDGAFYESLINDAKEGKKILVLAGSRDKARALKSEFNSKSTARQLKKVFKSAGLRVAYRDGRYSTKQQKQGFAKRPTETVQDAQIVILSRLAETGIDLQCDFDTVYCATSPSMSYDSVVQFFSRCRSLLRGDTPKLCLYDTSQTFVGVHQLSEQYWVAKARKENKSYLKLIEGDTTKAQEELKEFEWAVEWSAKYKADEARKTFFRSELLRGHFAELGWPVVEHFSDESTNKSVKELLDGHIKYAKRMGYRVTARSPRTLDGYQNLYREDGTLLFDADEYRKKLEDPTEDGFILTRNRRQIELNNLFPESPLEDKGLIETLEENTALIPQMLLRGAIELDPSGKEYGELVRLVSEGHLQSFLKVGVLQGLKELKGSRVLLTLRIAELVKNDSLVTRVLRGDDDIRVDQEDVAEFAEVLAANADTLNLWSQKYWQKEFVWDEDPISSVCKFLDKYLGIPSARVGQKTVTIDGKQKRVSVMRTSLSSAGRYAIAKQKVKKWVKKNNMKLSQEKEDEYINEEVGVLEREVQLQYELTRSAVAGWKNRLERLLEKESTSCTLNSQTDLDLENSVQGVENLNPDDPIRIENPRSASHKKELVLIKGN